MKKFKRADEVKDKDGVDRISNLPDHILQSILLRIPSTEELKRTSILSRRWRHLWTLIPSIDIDYTRRVDSSIEFETKKFKRFVYWVLLNKPPELYIFRLWCLNHYDMPTIRRWIQSAVGRKPKLLDLMFCPKDESEDVRLPLCLVTCSSLEVLKLYLIGSRLCSPTITGFSALRVLELRDVLLKKTEVLKYFLESCPLLEELSLVHCDASDLIISSPKLKYLRIEKLERVWDDETEEFLNCRMSVDIQISCPNLMLLYLIGSLAYNFLFENLCSLKTAVIHIKDLFELEDPNCDVFDELYHVETLSISIYCVAQCYCPRLDEPISLPNLKTLEITVDDEASYILIPFLKCFPDLESLHLVFVKYVCELDKLALEEPTTISMVTRHLKKVEFLEFDEEQWKIDVARSLLEHGNELEEMVFNWSDETRFHVRSMETMKKLSNFHKASSNVKIRGVLKPKPKQLETGLLEVTRFKLSQVRPRVSKYLVHDAREFCQSYIYTLFNTLY